METIINWFVKFTWVSSAWNFLDGKKVYATAGLGILTGLAGLGGEVAPLLATHNTAGIIGFARSLPTDQFWHMIIISLGAIGFGHKMDKAATPEENKEAPTVK